MMREINKLKPIHQEVLDFIDEYYEIDKEAFKLDLTRQDWERIYLNGNCYFFAKQLQEAFPQANLLFREDVGHAVVEIEGLLFDVRGILTENFSNHKYIVNTPLFEKYAQCWSYSWEEDGPTDQLYPKGIMELISVPCDSILKETHQIIWELPDDEEFELADQAIDEVLGYIKDYFRILLKQKPEILEDIEKNGWIDQYDKQELLEYINNPEDESDEWINDIEEFLLAYREDLY